jgi:hypothetical protein
MAREIMLRCQCGNRRQLSLKLALSCFDNRPEGATEVLAECCPFCVPGIGHYPSDWVVPTPSAAASPT